MNILKPILSIVLLFGLIFAFYSSIQKEGPKEEMQTMPPALIDGKEVSYGTNSGEALYPYELTNIETNEKIKLEANGKKKILFFWASWCPYCKQTAPTLSDLSIESEDLEVIGLTVPDVEADEKEGKKFIEELGIKYSNYEAQKEMYEHFSIQSFPTVVFVNSDGTIAQGVVGGLTKEMIVGQLETMY